MLKLRRNYGALDLGELVVDPGAAAEIDALRSSLSSPISTKLDEPLLLNTTFSPMTTALNTTKPVIKTPNPNTAAPIPPVPKRGPLKR
jgi:hypothetical protein